MESDLGGKIGSTASLGGVSSASGAEDSESASATWTSCARTQLPYTAFPGVKHAVRLKYGIRVHFPRNSPRKMPLMDDEQVRKLLKSKRGNKSSYFPVTSCYLNTLMTSHRRKARCDVIQLFPFKFSTVAKKARFSGNGDLMRLKIIRSGYFF